MKNLDPNFLIIISDLFVNLSAGWLGAIVIISPTIKRPARTGLLVLTADIFLAIVSLIIAFILRKNI